MISVWMLQPGEEKLVGADALRAGAGASLERADRTRSLGPRAPMLAAFCGRHPDGRAAGGRPERVRRQFPADVPPQKRHPDREPRPDSHAGRRHALRRRLSSRRRRAASRPRLAERPTAPSAFPRPTRRPCTSRSVATCTCSQDVRGRHESEGVWEPFFNDEKDGYDTIEWAAKQPWSDGKVAMQGGSYLGQNQWRAAQAGAAEPRHDLSDGGVDQHLPRLDHAQRRLAAVVQLRLGARAPGIAHHAEPGSAHRGRACARSTTTRSRSTCR